MVESSAVERVIGYVRGMLPDVSIDCVTPAKPDGRWLATFRCGGQSAVFEYQEHTGLAVSNEKCSNAASAAHRVIQILTGQQTLVGMQ